MQYPVSLNINELLESLHEFNKLSDYLWLFRGRNIWEVDLRMSTNVFNIYKGYNNFKIYSFKRHDSAPNTKYS